MHTGYDTEELDVADHMYVESLLEKTSEGIAHFNSFVVGEIRTDCETCFDSERVKTRKVGTYSPGKLSLQYKTCACADLRGPSPTPRGMSMEITLREGESRVRVLLAHEPYQFEDIGGIGQVPCTMLLRDIVIVRERLGERPLELSPEEGGE